MRAILVSIMATAAARAVARGSVVSPSPGAPLTVQPCHQGDAAQALIVSADATVRSSDGALCVTLPDAPFPAALTMEVCSAAPSRAQSWLRVGSTFRTNDSSGDCVAWNTGTDTLIVSSYTCASIAWNGYFTPSGGEIWANYTAPNTPVTPGSFCVTAAPQPPPPTCPAAQCADDTDCNLNGACGADGACTCYKPWGGATCGELRFLPIAAPAATNGFPGATANETTWGGNAIFFEGVYHLFVAEMVQNCSLAQWGTNSRCAHAVSSTPEGPYARVDVAVDVWCHNPQVSYIPGGGAGGKDLWALWHIGSGTGGHPAVCAADGSVVEAGGPPEAGGAGSPLHVANSPFGPWTPVLEPQPGCNNPTQFRHPNGTWFLVCDSYQLYSGPNVTGPWRYLLDIPRGGTPGIFEDGFLFIDQRGFWHQFFHTYTMTCDTPLCDPTSISGHSFSRDGLTWYKSCVQPYFNTANVSDGSVVQMSTRERPKLLFNAAGEPTHLFNGVCPTPHCPPQAAIQCKVQGLGPHTGYWDHTLVVPLDWT
jgi:hypothetical protein